MPTIFEVTDASMLAAVNAVYAHIHFAPSELIRDRTFYGTDDAREGVSDIVCLGRINLYDDAIEVGGFWVHDTQRGRGLARTIVRHVLAQLPKGRRVYCIPFVPLLPFYESFGMKPVDPGTPLPPSIEAKARYCDERTQRGMYAHPLGLLCFDT